MTTTTDQDVTAVTVVTIPSATRAAAVLSNGALFSGDDNRPVLASVRVRVQEEGRALFEATDSYALIRQSVDVDGPAIGTEFLIPATLAGDAAKLAKKKENAHQPVVIRADAVNISISVGNNTLSDRTIVGNFPNSDQLWPTEFTGTDGAVGIGAWQLARLAKIIDPDDGRALGTKSSLGAMFFQFNGPLKVMQADYNGGAAAGGVSVIVMPVRK